MPADCSERSYLTNLVTKVANLGAGLMATTDHHTDGLVRRSDLPAATAIPLAIWARRGLDIAVLENAASSLRSAIDDAGA
jgi:hypothetical protein